jgi:hypothetical protein
LLFCCMVMTRGLCTVTLLTMYTISFDQEESFVEVTGMAAVVAPLLPHRKSYLFFGFKITMKS